ncbi:hypothetical protein [Psychrobacillus sp. NPDC096623]|uniref:hypothetical protein n=1 Tax=Psychrobacillus sp. NPDC096623 TaxID=3364492 RepID=UPI003828246A
MKFIFVAPIFQMEITNVLNKGKHIGHGMYISNSQTKIQHMIHSERVLLENGLSLMKDLQKVKTYFRCEGKYEGNPDEAEYGFNKVYNMLRQGQYFLDTLWKIKDHGSYVREGFLFFYEGEIERVTTDSTYYYRGSLSHINSLSNGSRETVRFDHIELEHGIKLFVEQLPQDLSDYGSYDATDWHFYSSVPETRANYFLTLARSHTVIPMKLLYYCSLLESIYSIDSSEINHKIAERVAITIGNSTDDKKQIYNDIKKAYDIRSRVIHGSLIKPNVKDSLIPLTESLDIVIRRVFKSNIFKVLNYKSSEEFNNYFLERLLSITKD